MKYVNAAILPDELLKEVQKYIHGTMVYIPNPGGVREGWGMKTGSRASIKQRNAEIRQCFSQGTTVDQLSEQFFLSCESIKKIVYARVK